MSGNFALTESAAKYGVTGFDALSYFTSDKYYAFYDIIGAHSGSWVSGQQATFTADAGGGLTYVFSGSYSVFQQWYGPARFFNISSLLLQSSSGETLARFTPDPSNGEGFGPDGNVLDLMGYTVQLTGNSADNVYRPDRTTTLATVDGGGGLDIVDLRGMTSWTGEHLDVTASGEGMYTDGSMGLQTRLAAAGNTFVQNIGWSLKNVERVLTDNWALAYDFSGDAGQAYRLYQAAFDRTPDSAGLGYWINQLDAGQSLHAAAQGFIDSAEFKALYGASPGDTAYVTALYMNVLHRAPDAGGFDFWINALHTIDRAQVLVDFSESAENQANVIGAISQGILYTPVH